MHKEILSDNQSRLLPLISAFSKDYYLAGGTAIALQVGHRQSLDFDLFTKNEIKPVSIKNKLKSGNIGYKIIHQEYDQLHILIHDVKITYFVFPYEIRANLQFDNIIKMPVLIDLAAMKAFAFGGRAKWKDYVDMYFLLKNNFSLTRIEEKAKEIFKGSFNPKLFRQQLAYFSDIDYSESIKYIREKPEEDEIKRFLQDIATQAF
jgi:hypothetical protein